MTSQSLQDLTSTPSRCTPDDEKRRRKKSRIEGRPRSRSSIDAGRGSEEKDEDQQVKGRSGLEKIGIIE